MISDFGLSKMEGKGDVMSTACGTPGYVGKRFGYIAIQSSQLQYRQWKGNNTCFLVLLHSADEMLWMFVRFQKLLVLCLVCSSPSGLDPAILLWVCRIHFHYFNSLQNEFSRRHCLYLNQEHLKNSLKYIDSAKPRCFTQCNILF